MIDRRKFLQAAGLSLAPLSARWQYGAAMSREGQGEPSRSVEHGFPLSEFRYSEISYAPGLHQSQLDQTHEVLMNLSEDSLLKPFRIRAGLPAPGCDLQGWYSTDTVGGETFGQWISALSRYYAITGDEATRLKVERLVDGFSRTIEPTGKIYGDSKLTTGPAYLYDKLVCGLSDAHQFARQRAALDTLSRATSAVLRLLPGRALDESDRGGAHETYTIPENQFVAWQRGGDTVHLELGKQYLHYGFFDPLARGQNVLPGRHAYSHVNALCSAAKGYLVLSDKNLLSACQNGYSFLLEQSFATGGWGPYETFVPNVGSDEYGKPPIRTLLESLTKTHAHFETGCGAFAHFKLTRYLLRITRQSEFGDSMERVMYNAALGAKPLLADGRAFYYSDYNVDGHKIYFDGLGGQTTPEWPCCSGTLPQLIADYRISSYFRDASGIYVNLFVPSTLQWQQDGTLILLAQSGSYPLGDLVSFTVHTSRSAEFAVRLRIPAWAQQPSIRINDKQVSESIQPGKFFELKRVWRSGDRIDLELPHRVILQPIDSQNPNIVAVMYGPLALFAITDDPPRVTRDQLLNARRLGREGKEWQVDATSGLVRLLPFWELEKRGYSTYLSLA